MYPSVVLVEDQPVAREMILDLLDGHVNVVASAEGPTDALEAVRRHNPAGALIDVNLGSRNGFQVARMLSTSYPGLKIVLTSANAEPVYIELASAIPHTRFVPKSDLRGDWLAEYWCRGSRV